MSEIEIDRLHEELSRAYDGEPWHGHSLAVLLAGVDARAAAAHPIPGAHSIWELVLHLAAWTGEVRARLGGAAGGAPPEGDFPEPGEPSEERWQAALALLARRHAELLEDVARFPAAQLDDPGGSSDPASGLSLGQMLHGVAQHHAYHGGQIALLKRAAGIG